MNSRYLALNSTDHCGVRVLGQVLVEVMVHTPQALPTYGWSFQLLTLVSQTVNL